MINVNVKKLHPDARLPTYGTDGAACFDLYALEGGTVKHGIISVFRTGLAFEVPQNRVLHIYSRSGMGFKQGIRLINCVGVIDSDYRGEVQVGLTRDRDDCVTVNIEAGDRIAQGIIMPVPRVIFNEVEALSETLRGEKGLGSTGA